MYLSSGLCKAIAEGNILLSFPVIEELNTTLRREKFNRYLLEQERLAFLEHLVRVATIIEITVTITECRDPKDNKFLELAVSGKADYIITGDDDLLTLNPFREIRILTPRDFLDL